MGKKQEIFLTKTMGILFGILFFVLYYYPINSIIFRIMLIGSIAAFIFIWSTKITKIRNVLVGYIIVIICVGGVLLLPNKNINQEIFMNMYVKNISQYNGVKYVRGGENQFGIDCSGLARRALIDTYTQYGLQYGNIYSFKRAFQVWWYDSSASALLSDYRNQVIHDKKYNSINEIPLQDINPGDIAITQDGIHVLNYLGNATWIEADPNIKKVIQVQIPSDNYWFSYPVEIMKWKIN